MAPAIFRPIARAVNKAIEMCCVSCPTGSTVDRLHIKVCFCDTPADRGETGNLLDGTSLSVNGSSVGWTLSNPVQDGDCITYDVNQPLSYGDVIIWSYDGLGGWDYPTEAVDISVTNIIGIPHIPSFDFSDSRNSHYLGAL